MSVETVLARIAEIQGALQPAPPPPAAPADPSAFSTVLQSQWGASGGVTATAAPALSAPLGNGGAPGIVRAAEGEVGQAEQPPGSNDSPRIATYRSTVAGAGVGPWCAYFASWCARQAGTPLGEAGQGFGSVSAVAAWAQRTGRWEPAGSAAPRPGDLIVWGGEHIGIVEAVDPDGSIHTIEGNSSDAVSRRTYGADGGGATGYVRMS